MNPRHTWTLRLAPVAALALAAGQPAAQTAASQQVEVTGHYDNRIGTTDAASAGTIRAELLKSRPPLRPGEVLEFVPGIIVTQHSGDGKANQYFLRGFNLDHGTDFATYVAGMPVNMPTHGHGQGYTDLNFLIPELVQRIDYRKGPYFARSGDFAAAGSADIAYRQRLDAPFADLTLGQGGYRRGLFAGSGAVGAGLHLLGALELQANDGPWTQPEDLRKRNGVLTLSGGGAQPWEISAMAYRAQWVSTDQIPQRLIDAGTFNGRPFGRFDSLDTSDGGSTTRRSLSGQWRLGEHRLSAYAMRYALALYSNFTYALDRPADGDQFLQRDRRSVAGGAWSWRLPHGLGAWAATTEVGAQLRTDRIRVGLYDTAQRRITGVTREDAVRQAQAGLYAQTAVEIAPALRAVAGLRRDQWRAQVDALSHPDNSGRASAGQWSPKLSLVAGPFARTELFLNVGRGLHSNDARGTTARIDPRSGDPVDRVPALAPSRGAELGLRTEAIAGLQSSLSLWQLRSSSELVYIGDAGNTEAAAGSRRRGVEWSNRWQPHKQWLVDADLAWTHARLQTGERIPNAVDRVASIGVTLRDMGPWSASLQWRYLGPGALIEDNTVRSLSSTTANLRVAMKLPALGRGSELTLDVFNLLDRKVNDIQYFYESQLPGETTPVEDRHVHPAEPRTLRLALRIGF